MADLRLPYPAGPQPKDGIWEARRKIAENLDAIADWIRLQARDLELDQAEQTDLDHPTVAELRDGAIVVDAFKAAVR